MGKFNLHFYQDINSFEIYKCLPDSEEPDCSHSFYEENDVGKWECQFEWQDKLVIYWKNIGENISYYLRFRKEGGAPRDYPFDGSATRKDENGAYYQLGSSGDSITLAIESDVEAHWSFDFYWEGASTGVIDPESKVKNPS